MSRRRIIIFSLALLLGALAYSQFRTWQAFDWSHFWQQTKGVDVTLLLSAVGCVYLSYVLRAVRWRLFLRPLHEARSSELISPTIIGFTGLALLGRPGELVRPYLIAKREGLTVTSQLGVWTVERIFDIGAFAVLLSADVLASRGLRELRYYEEIRDAGYVLLAATVVLWVVVFLTHRWTDAVAKGSYRAFSLVSRSFAAAAESKVRTFGDGLHAMRSARSFTEALGISLLIWLAIGLAYFAVLRAYPASAPAAVSVPQVLPHEMELSHVFPLIASSMAGSLVQLPAVGGGSQLAVIAMLIAVFQVPRELAVSCGILLWLVTFMSCVPAGLLLARRQHLSFRNISAVAADRTLPAEANPAPQASPGTTGA